MSEQEPMLNGAQQIAAGALALVGTVLTGLFAWITGASKARADMQQTILSGFNNLTDQLQEERLVNARRIVELEGRLANLEQWAHSLEELLRRHDIPVPERRHYSQTVFALGELPKDTH